jgi:threonine dehydratase
VADMLLPTPLELAPPGLAPGRELWLKREDVHELGSFKWRGARPALRGEIQVSTQALLYLSTDKEWLGEKRQARPGRPVIAGTPAR